MKRYALLLIAFIILLGAMMLSGCVISAKAPEESAPDTPKYNTIELSEGLIDSINKYLGKKYSEINIQAATLSSHMEKIDKGIVRPLHVEIDPDEYYYACAYFDIPEDHKCGEHWGRCCREKYIWVGFEKEEDIPEYYNGVKFREAFQVNKTLFCRNIIDANNTTKFEFVNIYKPEFKDGFNVAPKKQVDGTFIYLNFKYLDTSLNTSDDDVVYCANRHFRYYHIPCVNLEGEYYVKEFGGQTKDSTLTDISGLWDLENSWGEFYSHLKGIMIHSEDLAQCTINENGIIAHYYLCKVDDFAKIFE